MCASYSLHSVSYTYSPQADTPGLMGKTHVYIECTCSVYSSRTNITPWVL